MGLPPDAISFLEENVIRVNPCPHCKRDDGYEVKEIRRTGMYDDTPMLAYKLKDGTWAEEYMQYEVWSSGPMMWFGLQAGDKKFEWDESAWENE
jgi:hypothetical protein